MWLPERDKYSQSKTELEAMLASLFGGRVAEEIIFGTESITTGASDDIRRATGLARRMVTEWGFSEKLGPLRYNENEEEVFLGHSVTQRKNLSDATAKVIDEEIRRFVEQGEATARRILTEHVDELHALAKALLEYETLSADEVKALLRGEEIRREDDTGGAGTAPKKPRASVPTTDGADKPGRKRPGGLEPEPQPGA
jgi:cell division protease FtsH